MTSAEFAFSPLLQTTEDRNEWPYAIWGYQFKTMEAASEMQKHLFNCGVQAPIEDRRQL